MVAAKRDVAVEDKLTFRDKLETTLCQCLPKAIGLARDDDAVMQISGSGTNFIYRLKVVFLDDDGNTRTQLVCFRRPMVQGNGTSMFDVEGEVMTAARAQGAPVPSVLQVLRTGDPIEEGMFMEWVEGEGTGSKILAMPMLLQIEQRSRLGRQCGEAFARIHAIDVTLFEGKLQRFPLSARETVAMYRSEYDAIGACRPALEYTLIWLEAHAPIILEESHVVIHGDFRLGNIVVHPAHGLAGILDWETAHLGNRYEDLGWMCVPSWRLGHWNRPVGGIADLDTFCSSYETYSGVEIDRSALLWWTLLGQFRWAFLCLEMGKGFSDNIERLEHAVVGRRASEAELDCLLLISDLTGFSPQSNQTNAGTSKARADDPLAPAECDVMFPSNAQIVESVQHHFRQSVVSALARAGDVRGAYMARVAANALGIVARSLRQGPHMCVEELASLRSLLSKHDGSSALETPREDLEQKRKRLVRLMRDGHIRLDTPGLLQHLLRFAAAQLSLDQPSYANLVRIKSLL
eukprot:TRINITY_DN57373_c0_g1_i1.p1 TRINITY_DN57373_c0_g1~~TRINITY_DN57373_c0_g1_i1.p1  ORF type:complete len:519 (+),score=60.08 TRINITY_DN57373_c0_g1_i1:34-1590(+)